MKKIWRPWYKTTSIYSQDIEMEFDIEKFAMLIMRRGKKEVTKWRELLNQESIRTFGEKGKYKYLKILESYTTKKRLKNE